MTSKDFNDKLFNMYYEGVEAINNRCASDKIAAKFLKLVRFISRNLDLVEEDNQFLVRNTIIVSIAIYKKIYSYKTVSKINADKLYKEANKLKEKQKDSNI